MDNQDLNVSSKNGNPLEGTYYCLKGKIFSKDRKLFSLYLMYFKVVWEGGKNYKVIFSGKPSLMIVKGQKKSELINTSDSWKKFETEIRNNMKNTYSNHLLLYSRVYTNVYNYYYRNPKEVENQKGKNIFQMLSTLKSNVSLHLANIWTGYDNEIEIETESISVDEYRIKTMSINKGDQTAEILKGSSNSKAGEAGRAWVEWNMTQDTKIKNFMPVVSVNHGVRSRDLLIGDQIIVRPDETGGEGNAFLFYPSSKTFTAQIIDQVIDFNNCKRFLVLLEDDQYGDVEVYDELIKIKTVDNESKTTYTENVLSPFNWKLFLNLVLMAVGIFIVYILVSSLL